MSADRVIVVTGSGGMGIAVAQRLGPGTTVMLADVNPETLQRVAAMLTDEGLRVITQVTDVSDAAAVVALASAAAAEGRVEAVVHTAGVSPVQASVEQVLRVDLLGTALVLEAFTEVIASGGAGVCIASMAGALSHAITPMSSELEQALARTPASELLGLAELKPLADQGPGLMYAHAKRANQLRVRNAAVAWGRRGARINSVSPGVISTPMGQAELDGEMGEAMRGMVAMSATQRVGTPHDVASVVEFLVSPAAGFITGTDVLVDGGVVAGVLSA